MRIFDAATIEALLSVADCIETLERALRDASTPPPSFVGGVVTEQGKFHMKAALSSGDRPVFAAKINANFPDNPRERALPTIQGVLVLFDGSDGRVLAIMDSPSLTAIRTAAATGVAAKHLARPDASSAAIIGCGAQALAQFRALCAVRPIRRVRVFDLHRPAAERLAGEIRQTPGVHVSVSNNLDEATAEAELVVTSTSSRKAFLEPRHVRLGTFVGAVGTDNPDKQEIHPELLAASVVVVDDLEQCARMGDLHHALVAGRVERSHVAGTLADVVSRPDRFAWRADATIVFDSTGIPLEDVAAAARVLELDQHRQRS